MHSGISLTGTSKGPHRKFQLLRVPVIESNEIRKEFSRVCTSVCNQKVVPVIVNVLINCTSKLISNFGLFLLLHYCCING